MPKEPVKADSKVDRKERIMPPISLSLIPVTGPKDNSPMNLEQWNDDNEEYNALDKMKDFAEKAAFDIPKRKHKIDSTLKQPENTNNMEKLIESYSRISEFINGCDWSKSPEKPDPRSVDKDPKSLEKKYLDAKNEFMSENLMLMPKKVNEESERKDTQEVIDLSESEDSDITDIIRRKLLRGSVNVGKDGALSISVQHCKEPGSVR